MKRNKSENRGSKYKTQREITMVRESILESVEIFGRDIDPGTGNGSEDAAEMLGDWLAATYDKTYKAADGLPKHWFDLADDLLAELG